MNTTHQPPRPATDAGDRVQAEKEAAAAKVEHVKTQAKDMASQTAADVKAGAKKAASDAGSYVENLVREQKGTLADKVDEYRDAARAAVGKLADEEHAVAAGKIDRAAAQLDRVSSFLRDTEPRDLLAEASAFARRRPEYVFGGLFLAGLGVARFLKASERTRRSDTGNGFEHHAGTISSPPRPAPSFPPTRPSSTMPPPHVSPATGGFTA